MPATIDLNADLGESTVRGDIGRRVRATARAAEAFRPGRGEQVALYRIDRRRNLRFPRRGAGVLQ